MRPIATSAAWSVCLKVLADYRAHTSKHVVVQETRWHADYPRQDALGCRKQHQLAGSVSCPHIRPSLSSPSMSSPSLSIPAMSTPANSSVNVQSCNVQSFIVQTVNVQSFIVQFCYMSTPANSSVNVQSCNFSVPVSTIGNLFELDVLVI